MRSIRHDIRQYVRAEMRNLRTPDQLLDKLESLCDVSVPLSSYGLALMDSVFSELLHLQDTGALPYEIASKFDALKRRVYASLYHLPE